MSTSIGIVVFDDAEELDWVRSREVFKMTRKRDEELRVVRRAMEYDPAPPYTAEV